MTWTIAADDGSGILLFGGLVVFGLAACWCWGLGKALGERKFLDPARRRHEQELEAIRQRNTDEAAKQKEEVERIAREKGEGFPWLVRAYQDYFDLTYDRIAHKLLVKKHPARKTAQRIKSQLKAERIAAEGKWRALHYRLQLYESLFPWIEEVQDQPLDELIAEFNPDAANDSQASDNSLGDIEPWAFRYFSPVDKNQPKAVRFQNALDRYFSSGTRKTHWRIGRDYERYVGYLFERDGWNVEYTGIIKRFDDLGRDLVVTKHGQVVIVQCKNWAAHRPIHENHIFQLYGTIMAWKIDHASHSLFVIEPTPIFAYTNAVSDRAKQFAELLGIELRHIPMQTPYPCIKCNVSRMTEEPIYHLPFDQQYDNVKVEAERGECWKQTVQEAEDAGFRRAYRWRGE